MYTKIKFGQELKALIIKKKDPVEIGNWAYTVYLDWPNDNDAFLDSLLKLSAMEIGSEFAFTYEDLIKIADDLIAGKDVKI